jgi:hypothetical protein
LQRIGWASDTTRRNAEHFAYAVGQNLASESTDL